MPTVLGVSFGHESGAALLREGTIEAAVNEERFNRIKHSAAAPFSSIEYCLREAAIEGEDVDVVAVATDALSARHMDVLGLDSSPNDVSSVPGEYLAGDDDGLAGSLYKSPTELSKRALRLIARSVESVGSGGGLRERVPDYLRTFSLPSDTDLYLLNHHEAHAASAFYCSGFEDALVVTLDGMGDSLSGTIWSGESGDLEPLSAYGTEGSLGWFYGAVTEALGWWVGNGEGKTMGLGAFAEPDPATIEALEPYVPTFRDGELVIGHDFGAIRYWEHNGTLHWGFEDAEPIRRLVDRHGRERVAAAAQHHLETQVCSLIDHWSDETGMDNLAVAGGVFLNVKVNRRIVGNRSQESYFIFPNAGDGGLPTGAALGVHAHLEPDFKPYELQDPYLGPNVEANLPERLEERQLSAEVVEDPPAKAAELLADGAVLAWCQGRMEYGPRALGNRSILVDPSRPDSKDRVNERVKFRDSWRPFAPSVLEEAADDLLDDWIYDPYMITACDVAADRSQSLQAVAHVDDTCRPQIVRRSVNEPYWRLIKEFEERTGVGAVLNTSYNLSGEPIVRGARDAIRTFYDSGLDALFMGEYLLRK